MTDDPTHQLTRLKWVFPRPPCFSAGICWFPYWCGNKPTVVTRSLVLLCRLNYWSEGSWMWSASIISQIAIAGSLVYIVRSFLLGGVCLDGAELEVFYEPEVDCLSIGVGTLLDTRGLSILGKRRRCRRYKARVWHHHAASQVLQLVPPHS